MQDEFVEIRDAARKALSGTFRRDELKASDAVPDALVERLWNTAIEAGWTGLLVPEEAGGVGLGMSAAIVVAEELGSTLAPGLWAPSLALAPALALPEELMAELAAGAVRLSLAFAEVEGGTAVALVDHARAATHFLVVTRAGGAAQDLLLKLVPVAAVATIADHQPLDPGTPVATVRFAADGAGLAGEGLAIQADGRVFEALRIFRAAELVGVARGALALAVDYAKTRVQFGVAIGSFQAIKHRLADVSIATDAAALAVGHAAASWDAQLPSAALDSLAAWELAARAASLASAAGIQIHGAIGVSWEHDIHLFLKREQAIRSSLPRWLSGRTIIDHLAA